jgi:alpha-glucosidase
MSSPKSIKLNRFYFLLLSFSFLSTSLVAQDAPREHTATANVRIISEKFEMPELGKTRKIWAWFPKDYETSRKKYPVLYMHDAQNLFDRATSYIDEWKIDETMDSLMAEGYPPCIIIGIENGGESRLSEYTPWANEKYGGGDGAKYLEFLVHTLKPYIDAHYRTKSDAAHTAMLGSSLGGLFTYYAAMKYPDVFSKAGVLSPSFWYSKETLKMPIPNKKARKKMKFYFLCAEDEEGDGAETNYVVTDMEEIYNFLQKNGFAKKSLSYRVVPNGAHSEWFWAKEFPKAYRWLFE